jgi:hypothetical protein
VSPAPAENNPISWLASAATTAPGKLSRAPEGPSINLPKYFSQLAADPLRKDVSGIADLPPVSEISDNKYIED